MALLQVEANGNGGRTTAARMSGTPGDRHWAQPPPNEEVYHPHYVEQGPRSENHADLL